MRFLFLLFLIVALIPIFECYRFVRSPYRYRYRVERSAPNEENYRIARSIGGGSGYRVAPAFGYRIARSVDDAENDESDNSAAASSEVEPPSNSDSNNNSPYRYRIIKAVNPPSADNSASSNENPPDCTSGDRKQQINCIQAYFDKKSIQLSSNKSLPTFSNVYQNFFNDDFERNKQEYDDFVQCLYKHDVPEKCFYLTNLKNISKHPEDAQNYTEFFNTIDFLYKISNAENGLHCQMKDSVICEIEKETNNCNTFQKFVDCFLFLYDDEPCPTDFREDFCHLISTDLLKDEYIPLECFSQIDASCSKAPKLYSNSSFLATILFICLLLYFEN